MQPRLEVRLPLVIGALVLATTIVIGYGTYVEGRRVTLAGANARLTGVTGQLRDLFQQSASQLRALAATSARANARAYAAAARAAGRAPMPGYDGAGKDQVVASQLRDASGRVLASNGSWAAALDTQRVAELTSIAPGDSAAIGGFRVVRDTLVYPVIARVPSTASATRAGAPDLYVVHWRKLGASRRAREQLTRLIGSGASLFLGSPATGHWTDMERSVVVPVADPERSLAAEQDIPGTPWRVAVHFPLSPVMAPMRALLGRIAVLAAIALLLGSAGTWWVTHSVLRTLEARVQQRTAELKHVLEELRDAQDTIVRKEKLAMLGQLASGVGHELRNPLGVMTNAIYFLRMVLQPQPGQSAQPTQPPQVAEYLDILQQQITLSEKIVSDLLDFARLKPPQRKPVSLADVTRTQIPRLGSPGGVVIDNEVGDRIPKVLVDDVQVGQVVLNLLTNAVQAMERGGRIVIRARESNGSVQYEVADNGPGITPENLGKIFEPLFTTKARGIGLGLAVSRTLARANEGDLTVTSAPGQGATFHLTLPQAVAPAAPAGGLAAAPAGVA